MWEWFQLTLDVEMIPTDDSLSVTSPYTRTITTHFFFLMSSRKSSQQHHVMIGWEKLMLAMLQAIKTQHDTIFHSKTAGKSCVEFDRIAKRSKLLDLSIR